MVDEVVEESWKRTFQPRSDTRYVLGAFLALAMVACFCTASGEWHHVGESLLVVTVILYLSCRGILSESSGGHSAMGPIYLLLVALSPFLHPLLEPLPKTELTGLGLGLVGLIALQLIALSMLEIKVGDTGILCKRFLRSPVVIDWKDVETVKCRVVNRMDSSGIAISTNAKISIIAGRKRIAFSSLQCKVAPGEVKAILEKAAPAAVEWTLNALKDKGEVNLGPVRLCKNGFKVRGRLYCHMQMGQDSIQLEEGRKKVRFTYDRLLNGQYLMEILDRAKLRA